MYIRSSRKAFGTLVLSALFISNTLTSAAFAGTSVHTVKIENMQFTPQDLPVRKGDAIIWENHDIVPHTVTSTGNPKVKIESGTIEAGKSFKYVFRTNQDVSYFCRFHPVMKAKLISTK